MPDLASPHMTFDEFVAWAMEAELMGESRSGDVVPLRRGSERRMMNSIAETGARDWFRLASPKSWQLPGDADVRDIAELLNLYLDQPADRLDGRGPLDRWRNVKAAVCILSTEISALSSLAPHRKTRCRKSPPRCSASRWKPHAACAEYR
jgi:hypothetical protein